MKKTLSIVLCVLLVLLAVACSPESSTHVHEWEKTSASTATCEKDGSETWTCKICKESEVRPVEATGHTHASNVAGTAVTETVNGEKVTYNVTCSENGLYTFRCTTCGKSFDEVVTPEQAKASKLYTVNHVYLKDGKYTAYDSSETSWDNVQYLGDVVEATMFVAKSKKATCASCGDDMPNYNKVISNSDSSAVYAPINGMFVYEGYDKETGAVKERVYLDITQRTNSNGSLETTAGYVVSKCTDNKWNTVDYVTLSPSNLIVDTGKGLRYLTATAEGKVIYLTGSDAEHLVATYGTSGTTFEDSESALIDGDATIGKLNFKDGHNHKYTEAYSTSSGADNSNSIYTDSQFKVMTHLGMNFIKDGNHYLSCEGCGLSYYEVKCESGKGNVTDAVCAACGYSGKSGEFLTVKISAVHDPEFDTCSKNAEAESVNAVTNSGSITKATAITEITDAYNAAAQLLAAMKLAGADQTEYADLEKLLTSYANNKNQNLKDNRLKISLVDAKNEITTEDLASGYLDSIKALMGTSNEAVTSKADGINDYPTVAKALHDGAEALATAAEALDETSGAVETFSVKKNSILNLNKTSYTSFAGKKYAFAADCGWTYDSEENSVVLTDSGLKIVKDNATLGFAKSK